MVVSSIITTIGISLLAATLQLDTDPAKWIGYQILLGLGAGIGLQQPLIAVQTALQKEDILVESRL